MVHIKMRGNNSTQSNPQRLLALLVLLTCLHSACAPAVRQSADAFPGESSSWTATETEHDKQFSSLDHDNRFTGKINGIIETDSAVYMTSLGQGNYIHYYDKAREFGDYLCFQPQCIHGDDSCSAYIGSYQRLFEIYDGGICFARVRSVENGLEIIRCQLDGSRQELVRRIDYEFVKEYQPQYLVLHRGRCYAVGHRPDVLADGSIVTCISITAFSLEDASKEMLTIFEQSFTSAVSVPQLFCAGQQLYFSFSETTGNKAIGIFHRWNCDTEQLELLYSGSPEGCQTNLEPGSFWVEGDNLYFTSYRNGVPLIWRLSDGVPCEMLSGEGFMNACISDGVICLYKGKPGETRVLKFVDFQGNQLLEYSFENQDSVSILGGNRKVFYITFSGVEDAKMKVSLLLLDLTGQREALEIMDIQ